MASFHGRRDGVRDARRWPMIPFYIFYSMFGFQRTGDQAWALGDARGRGFMMGATAGRTTLHGEGLQHDDGHSHLLASTVPERPRLRPGLRLRAGRDRPRRRSSGCTSSGEDVFYYVTLYNENYPMPRQARRASTRGSSAGSTASRRRPRAWPARAAASGSSAAARSCSRSSRPRTSSPSSSAWRPRSTQRTVVPAAPPRRARGRSLEPAPPRRRSPACRTCARSSGRTAARSSSRRTGSRRCPDLVRPWLPRRYDRAGHRGLRPERHPRERCGPSSRSTRPNIAAAALSGLARCGASPAKRAAKGIRRPGHRPREDRPTRPLTRIRNYRRERHRPGHDGARRRRRPPWAWRYAVTTVAEARTSAAAETSTRSSGADGYRRRPDRGADRIADRPAGVRLQGRRPAGPGPVGHPPVPGHRARSRPAGPGRR